MFYPNFLQQTAFSKLKIVVHRIYLIRCKFSNVLNFIRYRDKEYITIIEAIKIKDMGLKCVYRLIIFSYEKSLITHISKDKE